MAKRKPVVKPYCSGTMTEAARNGFIKSALRSKSRRWKPTYDCLKDAYVGKEEVTSTNKRGVTSTKAIMHYRCAGCGKHFPAKQVAVDHINPVVPIGMDVPDWNIIINNLFCERENLQVLCKTCHDAKTKEENAERREAKK